MAQIADAAHVTKGALYHHFPSKEELYLALIHSDLSEKQRIFSEAIDTGAGCRERLARLTRAFLSLPREKRELIKLVRRDINIFAEPERADLIGAYQLALPELVERVIRDGIAAGELTGFEPRLLSWQFVATVEVTLGSYAERQFTSVEEWVDCVLDLFFSGAGVPREER